MTKRNNRQSKKMHLGLFQEIGFIVRWSFNEGTDTETIDKIVDSFISDIIKPNGLAYEGSGYLNWEGLVCLEKVGKCDESHKKIVQQWIDKQDFSSSEITDLFDIWWDYPTK